MAIVNGKKLAAGAVEGQEKLEESKSLPVLFVYNEGYRLDTPNSYRQVFTKGTTLKGTLNKFTVPRKILWVGKNLSVNDKDKEVNSFILLVPKEMSDYTSTSYLAQIEKVEEFSGERLRLSITTYERVLIHKLTSSEEGLYYGQYAAYTDLNLTEQEQAQALSIIEEIKEKVVTLKSLRPGEEGELEFPVKLESQTIEEYASIFSWDATSIFTDHNIDDQREFFTTENVVGRLQWILRKLDVLIGAAIKIGFSADLSY